MIGTLLQPLVMAGKGIAWAGSKIPTLAKWGLKGLEWDWYANTFMGANKPSKKFNWEKLYTQPGGKPIMFRPTFKSLTSNNKSIFKKAFLKTAQAIPNANEIRGALTRTRNTIRTVADIARDTEHIMNATRAGYRNITGLSNYLRDQALRFGFIQDPAVQRAKTLLWSTLGLAGLGAGSMWLYNKKKEEERKRILGNELYNRYLYYKYYPIKSASLKKRASIADALKSLGQSIIENPVKSIVGASVAGLAAKELYDQLSTPATVQEDKLLELVNYMYEADPMLQQVGKDQIYSALKTISTYNPEILKDPASTLQLVKHIINYGGVDLNMINSLVSMREKMQRMQGAGYGAHTVKSLLSNATRMIL